MIIFIVLNQSHISHLTRHGTELFTSLGFRTYLSICGPTAAKLWVRGFLKRVTTIPYWSLLGSTTLDLCPSSFKVALSRPALMPSIVSSLCQETSKFVKIGCIKPRYLIKRKTPSSFLKTFVIPKSQLTLFILVLGGFKSSQHQLGEERGWIVKTMCDANLVVSNIWRNGFSHTRSGTTQYILNCWLNRSAVSHKLKPSFFSGPISSQ